MLQQEEESIHIISKLYQILEGESAMGKHDAGLMGWRAREGVHLKSSSFKNLLFTEKIKLGKVKYIILHV